ncbi:hypothetical protein Q9966_000890 [Columba livia]|nr:hypothetical protein Q9966_000890 [Columba livia]
MWFDLVAGGSGLAGDQLMTSAPLVAARLKWDLALATVDLEKAQTYFGDQINRIQPQDDPFTSLNLKGTSPTVPSPPFKQKTQQTGDRLKNSKPRCPLGITRLIPCLILTDFHLPLPLQVRDATAGQFDTNASKMSSWFEEASSVACPMLWERYRSHQCYLQALLPAEFSVNVLP